MKKNSIRILCLSILIIAAGCLTVSEDKAPSPLKSADEARTLLVGKAWVVKDAGLKAYVFDSESNPDAPLSIDWLSKTKEFGEFETNSLKKFSDASIELNKDTVANTTGFTFTGPQTYVITDVVEGDTPPGIRLEISGSSQDFPDMSKATYTYYVLGANEKSLMLQTPNSINNRKVVLMLGVK